MPMGSRRAVFDLAALAALAVALGLGACTPREKFLGASADAGLVPDAERDATSDVSAERTDTAIDLGPPCTVGGTRAELPVTLGCLQAPPGQLVLAGGYVYWTVQAPGTILVRAPLVGGGPDLLVSDTAGAFGLVVDERFAYYTQVSVGRLMRVPLTGGAPTALAIGLDLPLFLTSDGGSLYWTGGRFDGKIQKLDLQPGAIPVTLIDGQAQPRAIAVRDGFVYWTDIADGTVLRTLDHLTGPADASVRTASRLASGLTRPTDLVLYGDHAYVPDGAGHIQRLPLDGGDLEDVVDVDGTPYGLATDGVSIYWSVLGNGGRILAAPLSPGGTRRTIVDHQLDPHFVAVNADNIYWTTWGAQPAVQRIAK
jgi:hypothetical protein